MDVNFLASVKECKCTAVSGTDYENVKDFVPYHYEGIPFRSTRKLNHGICRTCKGVLGMVDEAGAKSLAADMRASVAYLKEQDTKYKYQEGVSTGPMVEFKDTIPVAAIVQPSPKQWVRGAITYDFYDERGHGYGKTPFLIYATEAGAVPTALAQFIRPTNFKSITNVKVWGPDHTRAKSSDA